MIFDIENWKYIYTFFSLVLFPHIVQVCLQLNSNMLYRVLGQHLQK